MRVFSGVSDILQVSKTKGLWITVVVIGIIGSIYAVFGGLKAVAYSDTINGFGLLIGGLLIPIFALLAIGDNNIIDGLVKVYEFAPEKFNVIGGKDSVLPFEVLFTGLIINQLYFWGMNQTIIQRALGAKNLKEAQKGLLITGAFKIIIPLVIILPGVICYYYFQETYFDQQDVVYPELVKKVLPTWLIGFFAAVIMGAVLSTFNSVLNSAATLFSVGIYKRHINKKSSDKKLVRIGKITSATLAVAAILCCTHGSKCFRRAISIITTVKWRVFYSNCLHIISGVLYEKDFCYRSKSSFDFWIDFLHFLFMGLYQSWHSLCTPMGY